VKNVYLLLIALLLTISFLSGLACAEEWGEIREATLNLNIREKRTPKSEHVITLATGQRVKVDFLKDGWFAVFNLNESKRDEARAIGFANSKYLIVVPAEQQVQTSSVVTKKTVPVDKTVEGGVKVKVGKAPSPDPIMVGIDPSRIPVKITSDRMTYDETGKVVSFVGNVVAEHGQLTLWADKISAYFSSKNGKGFGADSVERIIADGNVRAKKEKTEGKCGKLTYWVEKQLLKMEQNPLLQDGPNRLTGEVINFHIRENRSEVIGGKNQRVKAVFMTPEKMKVQ
jgi:lipopolysaccharide export system protein LptA